MSDVEIPDGMPITTAAVVRKREMNRLERRFTIDILSLQQAGGLIQWFEFEPIRLRLGGSAFYKPDFIVIDGIGQVLAYELKGHWREAARARIKIAAARFPWIKFVAVKLRAGRWEYEEFDP